MRRMILLATSLALIITASLAFGLYLLDGAKNVREPVWALVICLLIGLAAATAAGVINSVLLPADILDSAPTLLNGLKVGLIPAMVEELLKILPLMCFISVQPFFDDYVDGVIFFAFSGLAFGLYENIDYTLRYGAQVGVSRLATLLFFHAATAGIFGYLFVKTRRDRKWWRLILGISGLIFVHALYNFSLIMLPLWPQLILFAYSIPIIMTVGLIWVYGSARRLDRQASRRQSK